MNWNRTGLVGLASIALAVVTFSACSEEKSGGSGDGGAGGSTSSGTGGSTSSGTGGSTSSSGTGGSTSSSGTGGSSSGTGGSTSSSGTGGSTSSSGTGGSGGGGGGVCSPHTVPAATQTSVFLDIWGVPVDAGDVITLWADNTPSEAGDIGAIILDSGGNVLAELDDEWPCTTPPFADPTYGCPTGSYTAQAQETVAVAFLAWSGSASPVGYCATLDVNGTPVDLTTPDDDDFELVP